jgi:hypothetical protein
MCGDASPDEVQDSGIDGMTDVSIWSSRHESTGRRIGGPVEASHAKGKSSPQHQQSREYLNGNGDDSGAKDGMIQIQPDNTDYQHGQGDEGQPVQIHELAFEHTSIALQVSTIARSDVHGNPITTQFSGIDRRAVFRPFPNF